MRTPRTIVHLGTMLMVVALLGIGVYPAYGYQPQQAATLMLPVFTMQAPAVTTASVQGIGATLAGLNPSSKGVHTESFRGYSRLTVPSQNLDAFVERYAATGGFNAFMPALIVDETGDNSLTTQLAIERACNFLYRPNGPTLSFVNADGTLLVGQGGQNPAQAQNTAVRTTAPGDCTKPGYSATPIYSTIQPAAGGDPTSILIGMLVQVPLFVNVGQNQIPLSGAGGHLSLVFHDTINPAAGLDTSAIGMAGLAMPFYGRETQPLQRNGQDVMLPARNPATVQSEVEDLVRASYPGASGVTVPAPQLVYNVSDPSTPQSVMEPEYQFPGIEVVVNGETIILRDVNVPALAGGAGGLGPSVAITTPTNNASFAPGSTVSFTGSITNGAGPYSYRWELEDGTEIVSGTLDTAGTVQAQTNRLPVVSHNGSPAPVNVYLRVTDTEMVERSAMVTLQPQIAPVMFLPVALQAPAQLAAASTQSQPVAQPQTSGSGFYDFGIEANNDYQPYGAGGSDLPGVPPDANGFAASMQAFGWGKRFDWRNASAWERDWRDCSLGGVDCSVGVDRTDFAYYSGHGGAGGLSMTGNNSSTWASGTNARFSTLRWAAFSSCQTLRAQPNNLTAPIRGWFNAFQGAHMLLGFNSNMADIAFGGPFAERMKPITFFGIDVYQMSIREAWVTTAFTMNAGKPAYIYAVGTNGVDPANNKLPRANTGPLPRPFPVASYRWVWWNE